MSASYKKRSEAGLAVVVLALAAVLGGLVYAFWGRIKGIGERPTEIVVKEPPPPPRPAPVKKSVEIRKPKPVVRKPPARPIVKPKPFVSDSRRKRALRLHGQGEAALKVLNFDLAAELFGEEADLLKRDPEASARARALCAKAEVFGKVTSGLKPNPEAAGDMVTLSMHSGNKIPDVTLLDERDGAYVIARRGMQVEIPRDQVADITRMTREMQRKRLLDAFERVERKTAARTGAACASLAKEAFRDRLKEKTLEYLEKAYATDGAALPRKVRAYEGKKLLRVAIWNVSTGRTKLVPMWCSRVEREYSDIPELVAEARELRQRLAKPVTVARNYRKTFRMTRKPSRPAPRRPSAPASTPAPEAERVTVVADKVRSGSGRNAKLIEQINTLFKEGMEHYVAGRPGNPNSNMHLSKAAKLFDNVVGLCDKALKNDPGNSQLESRQADASRYAYHSRKMKTLSL